MFTNVSTADKIETIVDCYCQTGLAAGVFGDIREDDKLCMAVRADGREFQVWHDENSDMWHVREGDAVGVDASLVYAASNLIGADLVRKSGRI